MRTSRLMKYLRPAKVDPGKVDPKMAIRARRAKVIGPAIAVAILITIVLPFWSQKTAIAGFCLQIAVIMAVGVVLAGLWGILELLWPDPVTNRKPKDRRHKMVSSGLAAAFLAAVLLLLAWLAASIGATSWFSYDVLKSLGLISYTIGGLLPVIGYGLAMYAVATRQIITKKRWRVIAIVGLVFSLLAPWFWGGYRLYLDYHVV